MGGDMDTEQALNSFISKVTFTEGCWLWTAALDRYGYGHFSVRPRHYKAYRWFYEMVNGPIAPGLTLDHVCHNRDSSCKGGRTCAHRRCVNPDHLEAVTNSV